MFWLKILKDFIKILREGQTPVQIAGGFALGAIVGLSPVLTLQGIVIWLIILIINVNLSSAILAFTLFSLIAYLLDPLFHSFGYLLLTQIPSLKDFYTSLYNAPIAPLTRFNNTIVMGSFVAALILTIPIFFGMKTFVIRYRTHIGSKVEKWKIYQVIKQSKFVKMYTKIRDLGGLR